MKTIEEILQENNLTLESPVEEILEKLTLVTVDEINDIKTVSVKPLPNTIRDKALELKDRMVNTIIDEEKGNVAIINKRLALLYAFLNQEAQFLTGEFYAPKRLSLLPTASSTTTNDRLSLYANDENNNPVKISIDGIRSRIIRTVDEIPSDLQKGQYIFLKK